MEETPKTEHKILTWPLRGAILVVIIGILCKIQHWPYSSIIIVTGFSIILCLYPIRFFKKNKKNWMDYIKLILAISWSIDGILVIFHLPYREIFYYIKFASFLVWFFWEGSRYFTERKKIFKWKWNTFLFTIAFAGVIIGILFKIQHWQGGGLILTCCIALGFLVFIMELWANYKK